ncbi:YqjK family protein [Ferrigenium sp. UT5]|uniref:YqjK family protein n=1 Tax=Ferrigenium sp. UT5 TaxID=3242105 RepID=UPI0038B36162
MNERLLEIRQRRGALLGMIAAQRAALAESACRWQSPLAALDRGISGARYLRQHPWFVAGIVGVLVIRRHSISTAIKWGWVAWRGYRYWVEMKSRLRRATALPDQF